MSRSQISENLIRLHERVAEAALRSGREPASIRVVAISKSHPPQAVYDAYTCGQIEFGENRVDEAREKQDALRDLEGVTWHMVGTIQSRKARDVAGHFSVVHSVDRMKIARRLDQHQANYDARLKAFLEVNVSGEESKSGWDVRDRSVWASFAAQIRPVFELPNLEILGLMTMAPWQASEAIVRDTFVRLRELRGYLLGQLPVDLPELSMGMTDDFESAVEEGATVLRIGRAIFGPRG